MKKYIFLLITGAMLVSGAMLNSCKKEQVRDNPLNASEQQLLKDETTCALPLYMGQSHYIGCVDIYINANGVYLSVNLDGDLMGYEVAESHLYYGETAPTMWQPGQFPYYLDENLTWMYAEEFGCGVLYDRWFALHLQLEKVVDGVIYEESAWLLPADGSGMPFRNQKGKPVGWGQYFMLELQYLPEMSNLELFYALDLTEPVMWTELAYGESGYLLCYDPLVEYYYLDADFEISVPLADGLNAFYLDPVDPGENPQFWADWLAKGVYEGCTGTWEPVMWEIINADGSQLPMFYVKVADGEYSLIDGLMYAWLGIQVTLQINGDYTLGTYGFSGTLQGDGELCESDLMTIYLTMTNCN